MARNPYFLVKELSIQLLDGAHFGLEIEAMTTTGKERDGSETFRFAFPTEQAPGLIQALQSAILDNTLKPGTKH